jgi:signal transduction histidine kinase
MGDKDKMAEVFINLIENALKFSKEEEALQITISTRDAGGFMEASVADNGIGIENQYLEKVFNKFFQIEESSTRKVGGVGLGLALVREIIGDHAGKVWAESTGLGKGSKFIFQIPVAEKT